MRRTVAIMSLVLVVSCGPSAEQSEKTVTATRPPTQGASTPLPGKKLSGAQVAAAIVGNTSYTYGSAGPKTESVYYGTDGSVRVTIKPDFKDTGTYKVSGDGVVCSIYRKFRSGAETCQAAYRVNADTVRWLKSDGSTFDETVVSGNPENL